jgi:hypothetical protein
LRSQGQAGRQRTAALHGLHEHRQQEDRRPGHHGREGAQHHRQQRHALPGERQIKGRLIPAGRPPGVRREEHRAGRQGRPGRGGRPGAFCHLRGAEQQPGHACGQHDQAGEVEPGAGLTAGGETGRDHPHRDSGEHAERHVDEEDAAPAARADERTADRGADRRAGEQQDAGQQGYVAAGLAGARAAEEHAHRQRDQGRGDQALQDPGTDQEAGVRGERAQGGRNGKADHAGPVHREHAEPAGQVRGGGQAGAQCEQIAADRPLHRGQAGVQGAGHRLDRHVDDARVEHGQQRAGQQRVLDQQPQLHG